MDLNDDYAEVSFGTYRCHDPASNLSIRVKVTNKGAANQETKEAVVHWQQKLFSEPELKLYSTMEAPETDLQKQFKEEASQFTANGQPPPSLIFTHVHREEFAAEYEQSRPLLSPALPASRLSERLSALRYRGRDAPRDEPGAEPTGDEPTFTSVERRLRQLNLARAETMFIMLYAEEEEHVLCRLDWSPSGQLTVRPDFSRSSQPCRLQVGEGQKGLHAYRVEWVSPAEEGRSAPRAARPQPVAARQREPARRPGPTSELPLPPAGTLRVALTGELVSASGFERDNLFIHYFMELPKGWQASADTKLWGLTQLSQAPAGRAAHFGFPVTAELMFGAPEDEQADWCPRWPTIYLEVLSEDALGVSRTEGYCHLSVPPVPGPLSRQLAAWRPAGDRVARLRRHFIGGSPELEDPSFAAVPAGFEGDRLSRYGFRTETTGEVAVRFWTLHQSQESLVGGGRSVPPAAVQNSVAAVLEAFRRARLRMLRARQELERGDRSAGRHTAELASSA